MSPEGIAAVLFLNTTMLSLCCVVWMGFDIMRLKKDNSRLSVENESLKGDIFYAMSKAVKAECESKKKES